MNRYLIILLLIFVVNTQLFSQEDTTSYDPVAVSSDWNEYGLAIGASYGNELFGEFGYYKSYVAEFGLPLMSSLYSISSEFGKIDDELILGPKIEGRIHYLMFNVSMSSIWYTNLEDKNCMMLRPEFGLGIWSFSLNYGYNINLYNENLPGLNRHLITLKVYLRVFKKIIGEYDRNGNLVE